jgi:hypothetical protein
MTIILDKSFEWQRRRKRRRKMVLQGRNICRRKGGDEP